MKVLTYGYGHSAPEELAAVLATRPDALVVDVRYSARSQREEWSGHALAQRLRSSYLHVRQLGNVNYRDAGPVQLADPEAGVSIVLAALDRLGIERERATVILLCACRDRRGCHRDDVARLLVRALGADDQGECPPAPRQPRAQLGFW